MTGSVKVFVSYSWKTEQETEIVDELEGLCKQRGIELIRDKKKLNHGDSIPDFMEELSKSDHIITIFSKPYFLSNWCMHELLSIYRRGDFAKRTHAVIADDCDLQDRGYRLMLVKYWEDEYKKLKSDMEGHPPDSVTAELADSELYRDISQYINKIVNFAKDR